IAEDTVNYLAEVAERPDYVKVPTRSFGGGLGGNTPRIGFTPGYGDEGDGVLMSEIAEGGPAAKAGLKAGDRIVEIGGKPGKQLSGYMDLMRGRKKGEAIELTVLRDGKKMTVQVTPEEDLASGGREPPDA